MTSPDMLFSGKSGASFRFDRVSTILGLHSSEVFVKRLPPDLSLASIQSHHARSLRLPWHTNSHSISERLKREAKLHFSTPSRGPFDAVREVAALTTASKLVVGVCDAFPVLRGTRLLADGSLELIQERATHGTVEQFLRRRNALSPDDDLTGLLSCSGHDGRVAASLAVRILLGVYVTNEIMRVAHGDIHSGNVILTQLPTCSARYAIQVDKEWVTLIIPTFHLRPMLCDFGQCCLFSTHDPGYTSYAQDDFVCMMELLHGQGSDEHMASFHALHSIDARTEPQVILAEALKIARGMRWIMNGRGRVAAGGCDTDATVHKAGKHAFTIAEQSSGFKVV